MTLFSSLIPFPIHMFLQITLSLLLNHWIFKAVTFQAGRRSYMLKATPL